MTTAQDYFIKLDLNPDNADVHFLSLPRDAVEATRTPLLPQNSPNGDVWWQLPEADRRSFRIVYHTARNIHVAVDAAGSNKIDLTRKLRADAKAMQAVVVWLRWLAVRQAKSEGLSWPDAYKAARERLEGTEADAEARTMKAAYTRVNGLLKAWAGAPATSSSV